MFSFFSRKKPTQPKESAPQLNLSQRKTYEYPTSGRIYDEMQTDAMVQTALNVKKLAVSCSDWKIEPASDTPEAKRHAEFVMEAFQRMEGSPISIVYQAMDAFAKGWSLQELVWEESDGRIWLKAVRSKDPGSFGLDIDAFGRIQGLFLEVAGEARRHLPIEKFALYIYRRGYASPRGQSDLDGAHRHWKAKRGLLDAWQVHLERFAMPTVMGAFGTTVGPDQQSQILRALENLQNSTAIVYPNDISISTLGGQKEPSTGFQDAIDFHNREIARAILGQTLATDEGRRVGSLSLGKVHLQVLLLQIGALRKEVADSVMTEQVIRPLVEANFGPVAIPRFVFEEPKLDVFSNGRLE